MARNLLGSGRLKRDQLAKYVYINGKWLDLPGTRQAMVYARYLPPPINLIMVSVWRERHARLAKRRAWAKIVDARNELRRLMDLVESDR